MFHKKKRRDHNAGFSALTFSTRLYGKLWEHVDKTSKKMKKWLQWHRNSELITEITSANICYYLRTTTIIDDNIIIMCPSDIMGWYNRGKKGLYWVNWSLENQYQTSKRVISTSFNKLSCGSKRAVSNSSVTKSLLNFDICSPKNLHKLFKTKTNNKPRRYVSTYCTGPPPNP